MQSLCISNSKNGWRNCQQKSREGISPAAIAAKLSESLRQQFMASGIPETAQALAVVSKQTKQVAGEFDRSSKQLTIPIEALPAMPAGSMEDMRLKHRVCNGHREASATI